MRNNKSEPIEECFIDPEQDQPEQHPPQDPVLDIANPFHSQLPANQLRITRRPDNMAPRTFFLERPFYTLATALNSPCLEWVSEVQPGRLKLKIANNQNLSLEEYFGKKKFKCVYNRLESYGRDSRTFQGRLKTVDSLVDYNWKAFKELQQQPTESKQMREDRIDSDFESGNLCRAYYRPEEPHEYYLLIENDLNTYGYNNWFFFRFTNAQSGPRRFTIVNLIKKTNFFAQGMLISIFSTRTHQKQGSHWFKGGDKVTFGNINLARNHHASEHYHFLSFEYHFQHHHDTVYFALNQPYTYSRLKYFIEGIQHLPQPQSIDVQVKSVGYSISNNIIPYLKLGKEEGTKKEIILILGRQHPCQTVGSFIAEAVIQQLTTTNEINQFLFANFDFLIIPMVNPDGVIHGSSRCNMAGFDLNRQWGQYIVKELTPETVKVKQLIANLAKSQKIRYMIDLHGHGKKLNSFFFSCKDSEQEDVRLLSTIMKKLEPRFSMEGCTYGISRDKENTIRSTINGMGIAHSYTLETSLFGWNNSQLNQLQHFNEADYQHIAATLLQSIFVMEADPRTTLEQLGVTREAILLEIQTNLDKPAKEESLREEDTDILSDSDPEGDRLEEQELLGKCANKTLQKQIQQELALQKKMRKKSIPKKVETSTRAKKSLRGTCPSALSTRPKVLSAPMPKDLQASSSKKISLSQKWKERRKEIEKKKHEAQKGPFDQLNERTNFTKLETRPRQKTETSISKYSKPSLPYSSFMTKNYLSKTKHLHQKIRTEFQELEQFSLPTEEEIRQTQARKSALQTKFNELKQESLNMLLTDTLSVLKIAPPTKHPSPEIARNKTHAKTKKEHPPEHAFQEGPKMVQCQAKGSEEKGGEDRDSVRYKKFRQFLSGSSVRRRGEEGSSVFYHFPLL